MRGFAIVLVLAAAFTTPAILLRCASSRTAGLAPGTRAPTRDAAAPAPSASPAPSPSPSAAPAPTPAAAHADRIDFTTQILPLLQERCSPCHFPGGRMYDRLPFDKEMTIRLLGTRLFTRLREPEDQELIGAFLEQSEQPAR